MSPSPQTWWNNNTARLHCGACRGGRHASEEECIPEKVELMKTQTDRGTAGGSRSSFPWTMDSTTSASSSSSSPPPPPRMVQCDVIYSRRGRRKCRTTARCRLTAVLRDSEVGWAAEFLATWASSLPPRGSRLAATLVSDSWFPAFGTGSRSCSGFRPNL